MNIIIFNYDIIPNCLYFLHIFDFSYLLCNIENLRYLPIFVFMLLIMNNFHYSFKFQSLRCMLVFSSRGHYFSAMYEGYHKKIRKNIILDVTSSISRDRKTWTAVVKLPTSYLPKNVRGVPTCIYFTDSVFTHLYILYR